MDRTETYNGSDGRVYAIHFEESRYIVKCGGDIFTVGQQPESPLCWADRAAREFVIADIEARIRAEPSLGGGRAA
jgi:hypothetical protein